MNGRGWAARVALFLLLFSLLQLGYEAARSSTLQRLVIEQATVQPAAALIGVLWPHLQVRAEGTRIRAEGGGLNVLHGCEGLDVALLLLAAMLVAPLPWRTRLWGLAWGLPLVWALNQARVLALFHAYRHDRAWFELLHGGLAPLLLVLLVAAAFSLWLGRSPARTAPPGPGGAAA
jgi:exosortase/archaeosortase family protein